MISRTRLPRRRTRAARRLGCLGGCLLLIPLSMCLCNMLWLAAYWVFPPAPVDIVMLGLDARPGEGSLTRTDSVILVNITPRERAVTMLSIPRDVFIWVPEYGEQRINAINVLAEQDEPGSGPALMAASLEESFGVEVDRYVRLDFQAFIELVDTVGGIDVNVPKLIIDYDYPTMDGGTMTVQFDPGREHMDGERALQYARTRHQDDDYRRAERQQQVIDALVAKLTGPTGILYWPQVWQVIQDNTDTDISTLDMLRLGPAMIFGWPNREQRVLQREDLIGMRAGYWRPDYEQLAVWINAHFD